MITYLLGAGASCNCVPIVSQFTDGLIQFTVSLKSIVDNWPEDKKTKFKKHSSSNPVEIAEELNNRIFSITDALRYQVSFDTYAKSLSDCQDHSGIEELKFYLTVYLIYTQFTNNVDRRYGHFIGNIFNPINQRLADDINILSWNYDLQFEIAFAKHLRFRTIAQGMKNISVNHAQGFSESKGFNIYKLNGSATFDKGSQTTIYPLGEEMQDYNRDELIEDILFLFQHKSRYGLKNRLMFSWETKDHDIQYFEHIRQQMTYTEVLVIIGYSFPFINRVIDSYILENCLPEQVVLQVPLEYSSEVIDNLISARGFKRENIHVPSSTNTFFIPPRFRHFHPLSKRNEVAS